ncbi:MAG: serine/threonine-protein kinase [Candidatus Sericytochromatia bacterium]
MSNINVGQSQPLPLLKGLSQHRIQAQPDQPAIAPTPSLEERRASFTASQSGSSPSGTPILNPREIAQQIETADPQVIIANSEAIPRPAVLQTGTSQTLTIPAVMPPLPATPVEAFKPSDLNLTGDGLSLARFGFKTALQTQFAEGKNQMIKTVLQQEMEPFLKELSKADKGFGISASKQNEILTRMSRHMADVVRNTGTKDELGILLAMTPKNELKGLLAEVVVQTRGGKRADFDSLSSKKQEFVNRATNTIFSNLTHKTRPELTKPATPVVKASEAFTQAIHTTLDQAALSPGKLAQLKLMSDAEILTTFQPLVGKFGDQLGGAVINVVRHYAPAVAARQVPAFVQALTPADVLGPGVDQALQAVSAAPGTVDAMANLTQALQTHLAALPADHNTLWQLGVMDDQQIKGLLQQAAGAVPGSPVTPLAENDVDALVQTLRAALPNKTSDALADHTTLQVAPYLQEMGIAIPPDLNIPAHIHLGDTRYEPLEMIGKAGYGAVFSYQNPNDPTDRVAVKILTADQGQDNVTLHKETVHELNLHRELQGPGGHQNVIGLKAAVHAPDGSLCMVMECATGGDLENFGSQLRTEVAEGRMSADAQQLLGLALLKQTLEGVSHMHDDRQMLHSDLKPGNLMLGSDGQVKLIDFGTAHIGADRIIEDRLVANPKYLAPEQMVESKIPTQATTKSDMWSIGTLAYNLLVGDLINQHPKFNSSFESDNEEALIAHTKDPSSRIMSQVPNWQDTPQNQATARLVDGLMMPMPEQRLGAKEALAMPMFQDPRLSSPEMLALLKTLAAPQAADIPSDQKGAQRFAAISADLERLASQA